MRRRRSSRGSSVRTRQGGVPSASVHSERGWQVNVVYGAVVWCGMVHTACVVGYLLQEPRRWPATGRQIQACRGRRGATRPGWAWCQQGGAGHASAVCPDRSHSAQCGWGDQGGPTSGLCVYACACACMVHTQVYIACRVWAHQLERAETRCIATQHALVFIRVAHVQGGNLWPQPVATRV